MVAFNSDTARAPRILFVDAFDSFTNNIIGLLEQNLGAIITLVRIDDKHVADNLEQYLAHVDAVVVGPGPGHPANPNDVGFIPKLWELSDAHILPILGICLGFQSLCQSQGAQVKKLDQPRHGIVRNISHCGTGIFAGVKNYFEATQYHSLHVVASQLKLPTMDRILIYGPNYFKERHIAECPSLLYLAWDLEPLEGPLLMAVRHKDKPFYGVQFHPESVCTSEAGGQLVSNWWNCAKEWLRHHHRTPQPQVDIQAFANNMAGLMADLNLTDTLPPHPAESERAKSVSSDFSSTASHLAKMLRFAAGPGDVFLRWGKHSAHNMSPTLLLEALGHTGDQVILLDSQGHPSGRYSIIGLTRADNTMKVTYKVTDETLKYGFAGQTFSAQLGSIDEVWPILQEALDMHDPRNQDRHHSRAPSPDRPTGMDRFVDGHLPDESPFWGGFMGYISYEAGLETIDVDLHPSCAEDNNSGPDINFAFVHRSIVIDHEANQVYIQSLLPGDWAWILQVGQTVDHITNRDVLLNNRSFFLQSTIPGKFRGGPLDSETYEEQALDKHIHAASLHQPTEQNYRAKVLRCQEFLASGDSYELCLTDESQIKIPPASPFSSSGGGPDLDMDMDMDIDMDAATPLDPWSLYKRLRHNNPAPFGAFLRLSETIVVGSSPERFLRWTRDGRCQFRPIKGTVKKGGDMTRNKAHDILNSSKERAENLMIVDLIRHDLAGVVGAENTEVTKLMVVEEYETVYQLVSVIEGQLPQQRQLPQQGSEQGGSSVGGGGAGGLRGLHVLKASLPPGSMTGAPKKRSCEILRDIEKRPRGVYSGVLGYMDVGGAGDFSVVIRTAIRNGTDESASSVRAEEKGETWRVGAGGAVTIQSTDEGEFLEMQTKAASVLGGLMNSRR